MPRTRACDALPVRLGDPTVTVDPVSRRSHRATDRSAQRRRVPGVVQRGQLNRARDSAEPGRRLAHPGTRLLQGLEDPRPRRLVTRAPQRSVGKEGVACRQTLVDAEVHRGGAFRRRAVVAVGVLLAGADQVQHAREVVQVVGLKNADVRGVPEPRSREAVRLVLEHDRPGGRRRSWHALDALHEVPVLVCEADHGRCVADRGVQLPQEVLADEDGAVTRAVLVGLSGVLRGVSR